MKDYRKSEYAKNKMNRTAIVYTHAGEVEVRLTFEKVSKDQPEITKEEFQIFKDASDEFFRIIENNDSREERNAWQKGNNEKIIMRCSNKECEGFKVLTKQMDIEEYIKSIFVRAIEDEGILEPPTPEPTDISRDKEMIKMTNELRFKMQNQDITETDIIKGINEIASERFSACSSSDNTERTKLIKEKIISSKGQSRIKAETIGEVVQRILLAPDQTVVVRLQNGMEFTERIV